MPLFRGSIAQLRSKIMTGTLVPSLAEQSVKRGTPAQFDRAVRNTYKLLLTRGMRGVTLYSTDPETQSLLASLTGAP